MTTLNNARMPSLKDKIEGKVITEATPVTEVETGTKGRKAKKGKKK